MSTTTTYDRAWLQQEFEAVSNWGRWGPDDELGAWNHVTPEVLRRAAACVRKGELFSLALLPLGDKGPNTGVVPGRTNPLHFMTMTGTDAASGAQGYVRGDGGFAEDWVLMNLSATTQWDGFTHAFHNGTTYNGIRDVDVSAKGAKRGSIAALGAHMASRGVLLDVPRLLDRDWCWEGEAIMPDLLDECCARQDVSVEPGDVVLIRTGHLAKVRARGEWGDYASPAPAPGLHVAAGRWLWEREVAAVATDTWGFEVAPYCIPGVVSPLHHLVLCSSGISIGEMFDLDAWAADCAEDGHYDGMLVGPPLPLTGAVNTPVNPYLLK